jgi:uncharacterized protein
LSQGWAPAPLDERDGQHPVPWEWFDAAGIYLAWLILSAGAAFPVVALVAPEGPAAVAAQILVSVVLLVLVTLAWVHLRGTPGVPDAVRRALGPRRLTAPEALQEAVRGAGYGVAAFVAVQVGLGSLIGWLVAALDREVPAVQEEVQQAVTGSGATPLLVAVGVAVLAPLGEELLYRGVLYQALAQRLPGWPAIGLSGLAFGLTHVEPLVIVLTFPLGMALAWMVRRHGTLVVPYTAHVVFNAIGVVAIRAQG